MEVFGIIGLSGRAKYPGAVHQLSGSAHLWKGRIRRKNLSVMKDREASGQAVHGHDFPAV